MENRKPQCEGLNEKIDRLQATLYRYCMALTRSRPDAEDLAQDTWMKVLGSAAGLEHANPEARMLMIARNAWVDELRRRTVKFRIEQRESFSHSRQEWLLLPQESGLWEMELVFQSLYNHMSPLQRAVFVLREVFGYTSRETADRLQMTEGAVKSALHRARQSLEAIRRELEQGELAGPKKTTLRTRWRRMAKLYHKGDIAALTELLLYGDSESGASADHDTTRMSVHAVSSVPVRYSCQEPVRRAGNSPTMLMVA